MSKNKVQGSYTRRCRLFLALNLLKTQEIWYLLLSSFGSGEVSDFLVHMVSVAFYTVHGVPIGLLAWKWPRSFSVACGLSSGGWIRIVCKIPLLARRTRPKGWTKVCQTRTRRTVRARVPSFIKLRLRTKPGWRYILEIWAPKIWKIDFLLSYNVGRPLILKVSSSWVHCRCIWKDFAVTWYI